MNKTELVQKVASVTGQTNRDIEKILNVTLDVITQTIKSGQEVMLTGFGAFSARTRHARNGVNPLNPSQKIQIPELRVPKFKAGKALKEALKGKSESQEVKEEIESPESALEERPAKGQESSEAQNREE